MEIPSITTALPERSSAFVFGSFLVTVEPADLDVLLLYDPVACAPKDAYSAHAAFIDAVKRLVTVPVDITLLTHEEAEGSQFLKHTGGISFSEVEDRLTMRWRATGGSAGVLPPGRLSASVGPEER